MWIAFRRSSVSTSCARSSAYVSISLPCQGWLDRPWPRRSWALARSAMAAAVMGDRPIAVRREEEHLVFKRITAEWPTVTEDNRLATAQVLVVNLRAVFGCDRVHRAFSFARARKGRGVRLLGDG